jgi:outer membrane protein assembly factor BamE
MAIESPMTASQPFRVGRLPARAAAVLVTAMVAGCSSLDGGLSGMGRLFQPYRAEVVQGNFVSREQVGLLKAGMPRAQVRDLLGTPLVASLFHAQRWDYVFTIRRQGVDPQAYRLTLHFKGDLLDRFEGDEMPTEAEFVARLDVRKGEAKPVRLEATEEELSRFSPATTERKAAAEQQPGPANYPPLEPVR